VLEVVRDANGEAEFVRIGAELSDGVDERVGVGVARSVPKVSVGSTVIVMVGPDAGGSTVIIGRLALEVAESTGVGDRIPTVGEVDPVVAEAGAIPSFDPGRASGG
jgi:hypothetical protein